MILIKLRMLAQQTEPRIMTLSLEAHCGTVLPFLCLSWLCRFQYEGFLGRGGVSGGIQAWRTPCHHFMPFYDQVAADHVSGCLPRAPVVSR